jgi:hypothetical protein
MVFGFSKVRPNACHQSLRPLITPAQSTSENCECERLDRIQHLAQLIPADQLLFLVLGPGPLRELVPSKQVFKDLFDEGATL